MTDQEVKFQELTTECQLVLTVVFAQEELKNLKKPTV